MDTSPWDRSNHPLVPEFKNLDVTQRGELIHEGDLEWRLNRNRSNIKLRVLLFQDFIILLTRVNAGANQPVWRQRGRTFGQCPVVLRKKPSRPLAIFTVAHVLSCHMSIELSALRIISIFFSWLSETRRKIRSQVSRDGAPNPLTHHSGKACAFPRGGDGTACLLPHLQRYRPQKRW